MTAAGVVRALIAATTGIIVEVGATVGSTVTRGITTGAAIG